MNESMNARARSIGDSRRSVVIAGAGPSGVSLAIRLRQRGLRVLLFDSGQRPPLLVGESLIPAVVPHLESLGVANAVAAIGVRKPGATLVHGSGERAAFHFRDFGKRAPDYAWNVPRPEFDEVLLERAHALGVEVIAQRASFCAHAKTSCDQARDQTELALDQATLEAAGLDAQPGLIVDATGRSRVLSRTLGLSSTRGGRDDVACFAHFACVHDPALDEGRILIAILEQGWCWRIPLPDRVSVGLVVPRQALAAAGGDAAALLESRMRSEPLLRASTASAQRVSKVMRYEHYQRIGERAGGSGWAAVGDAFGFVDPMLSPGVFMGLESAALLNHHVKISIDGVPILQGLDRYEAIMRDWLNAWTEVIETFYDGRMLALQRAARVRGAAAGRFSVHPLAEATARRAIAQLVSGANTRSRLSRGILQHSARHLLRAAKPEEAADTFAVKGSESTWAAFRNAVLSAPAPRCAESA